MWWNGLEMAHISSLRLYASFLTTMHPFVFRKVAFGSILTFIVAHSAAEIEVEDL